MANIIYVVQRPGEGPAILNAYRNLARSIPFDRLTGLYAFASRKGARLLVDVLRRAASHWGTVAKRWVISIDGGITEPNALRLLLQQKRTAVYVHDGEELLSRNLKPIHRFHPKTLLLETRSPTPAATGILVGSANLTCNGLCFGHEHALVAHLANGPFAASLTAGIDELSDVVASATRIDEEFVARYEAIRPPSPRLREDFEDRRSQRILQQHAVIPSDEAAALASANNLWVEIAFVVANRGRGKEGNQIDLKKGTRVFFGFGDRPLPRNSSIGTVRIRYGEFSANRNLRFGNNQMDKLDLPIPGQEGPPTYRDQTLLFTREPDGSFRMTLGTSEEIANWKRRSQTRETSFQMRGGREYGVF